MCRLAHAGLTSAATARTTDGKAHEKEICFKNGSCCQAGGTRGSGEKQQRDKWKLILMHENQQQHTVRSADKHERGCGMTWRYVCSAINHCCLRKSAELLRGADTLHYFLFNEAGVSLLLIHLDLSASFSTTNYPVLNECSWAVGGCQRHCSRLLHAFPSQPSRSLLATHILLLLLSKRHTCRAMGTIICTLHLFSTCSPMAG